MKLIKAKPTIYNGIPMRSMLETRWARFLDYLNIEWVYEPQAYVFDDGTMYLPDFYLPQQNIFLEVKGIMTNADMHKIQCLGKESGLAVVIGYENGKFEIFEKHLSFEDMPPSLFSSSESALFLCSECGKYWFANFCGGWECKCCGAYDGDHYIKETHLGCENKLWKGAMHYGN